MLIRPPILAAGVAMFLIAGALVVVLWTAQAPDPGTPDVGGPFDLMTADGTRLTDRDLLGHPFLIFFGFASCPDVCPATLATVAGALDSLGEGAGDIAALFVTLDPERDAPATADAYARRFHPAIRGLGGTREQIAAAAAAYRVYYRKVDLEGSAAGYTIDHSAIVFLMGADGNYRHHFTTSETPDVIAAAVQEEIGDRL